MKKYESYILLPMNTWNLVDILWLNDLFYTHSAFSASRDVSCWDHYLFRSELCLHKLLVFVCLYKNIFRLFIHKE